MTQTWIWQHPGWPGLTWDESRLSSALSAARLAQGKVLGAARLLDTGLTLEAMASILAEDGLTTSAIEGEKFDPASVRSSVARRLGLQTAGLPRPRCSRAGIPDCTASAPGCCAAKNPCR